jgi:hypothetical protein
VQAAQSTEHRVDKGGASAIPWRRRLVTEPMSIKSRHSSLISRDPLVIRQRKIAERHNTSFRLDKVFAACLSSLLSPYFASSRYDKLNHFSYFVQLKFQVLVSCGFIRSVLFNMATAVSPDFNEKTEPGIPNISPSIVSDDSFTNPTGINEKKLLRKLDLRLLPPLTLLYLLSFLDRSNGLCKTFEHVTLNSNRRQSAMLSLWDSQAIFISRATSI